MEFNIINPHPALRAYIHHYAMSEVGSQNSWSAIAMVPPGCGVLGVVVGDKKILFTDGDDTSKAPLLSYAGQLTHFKELRLFGRQTMVYAVMRPCGAFRFLGVGQDNCTNKSFDLLDLLPIKERSILQQFEDCQVPDDALSILESLLLRLLLQQKEKSNLTRIASVSEYLLRQSSEPLIIKKMCTEEGFSKSALERNFREFVGIGPKQYHRIVRFNNLLKNIRRQKQFCHWTETAQRFGYYDQAHFIKDFKLFYGKTPSAFSSNDELLSNITQ